MHSRMARLFALVSVMLPLGGCDDPPLAPDDQASLAAAPGASSNLSASASSSSRIELTWQDNSSSETGFEVHRSTTGPSGTFTSLARTGPNVPSYSDVGLIPITQYCYKVRAFRTTGRKTSYSAFSNTSCATTFGPPPAASNTNATPVHSSAVDVTWSDNSGTESGFRVERSPSAEGPWVVAVTAGPNVTSHRDWGRATDQQVCYRVTAFNTYGESAPSTHDCTIPPAPPTSLTATALDGQSISLAWNASAFAQGYEVQRAGADGIWSVVATLQAEATSHRDNGLSTDTRYWYRVRALRDGGYSDFSNTANAATASVPPPTPSATDAVPAGSSAVTVSWESQSPTVEGFRVERWTTGATGWTTVATTPSYQRSLYDYGLLAEQNVCYRVIAFNGIGDSAPSDSSCTTPPAAPTGLEAAAAEGYAIDLRWTADPQSVAEGFEVQRLFCYTYGGGYGGEYTYCYYYAIATVGRDARSYRDTGLSPSETHWYVVVALKDGGRSDWSNEATATTHASQPE